MPRSDPGSEYARALIRNKPAPKPPFELNADQMVVWDMIVATRAPEEWSGIDEFLACDLAIATIALRDARRELVDDDPVLVGPQGGHQINPLMGVVSSLCNQVLRLSGRLRLGSFEGTAQNSDTTAAARKRKIASEAQDQLSEDESDNLIAMPRASAARRQ